MAEPTIDVKGLKIDVKDLRALETYANNLTSSPSASALDPYLGKPISNLAQQLEGNNKEFREARYFATNAVFRSDALEQFISDVRSGVDAYANFALGSMANYLEADLKSEEKLAKIEEIIRNMTLRGPSKPNIDSLREAADKPYDDHGWDKRSVSAVTRAHTEGRQHGHSQLNNYQHPDPKRRMEGPPGKPGSTDWVRDEPGETFQRVHKIIGAEPADLLSSLGDNWRKAADRLDNVASLISRETKGLGKDWSSPAARMLQTRVDESVRAIRHWSDDAQWRSGWMHWIRDELVREQDWLEKESSEVDRLLKEKEKIRADLRKVAASDLIGGPYPEAEQAIELIDVILRLYDTIAVVRATNVASRFTSGGSWVSLPKYPGLLDIPKVTPDPSWANRFRSGGTPGGGAGAPGGGGVPGGGGGAPGAEAARKHLADLRKQQERLRKLQEQRQKEYNDAVRKLNEDAKKQQEQLRKQQESLQRQEQQRQQELQQQQQELQRQQQQLQEQLRQQQSQAGNGLPNQQQGGMSLQDLEDMRRRLEEQLEQMPQVTPPNVDGTEPPGWAPTPIPGGIGAGLGGLGSGLAGVGGGTGGGGVGGGGGGGGFGRPSVSTGIPTSGAVDLMGRTGGGAATTGVGTPALTGRATGAGGVPFIPPMHPPMAGAGAGGGPTLGGRRNRPVLPEEAQKPAPKPRVVDPDGDGTTTARRYRDGDRRATVTEPARRPEVEGGQALGRLA